MYQAWRSLPVWAVVLVISLNAVSARRDVEHVVESFQNPATSTIMSVRRISRIMGNINRRKSKQKESPKMKVKRRKNRKLKKEFGSNNKLDKPIDLQLSHKLSANIAKVTEPENQQDNCTIEYSVDQNNQSKVVKPNHTG